MSNIKGKVMLITGVSSGFGRILALQAAKSGYKVIGTSRKTTGLDDLTAAGVTILELESTWPESKYADFAEKAGKLYGHIDVVIVNSGITAFGTVEESSVAQWDQALQVNFWGSFKVVHSLMPHVKAAGSGAKIIFNASIASEGSFALGGPYNVSKAALIAMADTLRTEVAGYKIEVMTLQAGMMKTDFVGRFEPAQTSVEFLKPVAEYLRGVDETAPLDPAKGAKRVLDILESGKPLPERLPFGQQAYQLGIQKWQQRLDEAKVNEQWSKGIDLVDP